MADIDLAKENIYRDYHSKVLGYIRSKINNLQDAEDLAADVFVKVYEKYDSFDNTKASVSTWIFTITRNAVIDYFRTSKDYDEVPETIAADTSVEDEVCNNDMLDSLAKALRNLDERERDIIVMRYYEGVSLKDIADKMGISYAYVRVLQNKALQALRDYLE